MLTQSGHVASSIRAAVTFKRPFARVNSRMKLQMDLLRERLRAELTLEGPLARVDPPMSQQSSGIDEIAIAKLTDRSPNIRRFKW